ncbi:MAG: aminoglycoside phosphotransferase family protein [Parachlamydiaceae bacterium]|nr:aminoglycoside phosphotransferase family protein [Parachlamydiaceae bacterium]
MKSYINIYQQRLNLKSATFARIEHEDAMVAIVYKVVCPDGTQLILKICERPNDYLREVYFLNHFSGQIPLPRIIRIVPPEMGIHGAILMECLPGTLIKIIDYTDILAFEMGSLLARIHLNRVAGYGDLIEPEKLIPDPRVHFTLKFEEGLDECNGHLPKSLIDQCRLYFNDNLYLLATVDGPCMIHRDFRAGNVIVGDGEIQGIIDWSSARASFAEDDFCPFEHGEWPANSENKKSFLAGYASIRTVPDYQKIMPFLRLNRAVATVGFTVKRGTWNGCNAHPYLYNRRFLETFFSI